MSDEPFYSVTWTGDMIGRAQLAQHLVQSITEFLRGNAIRGRRLGELPLRFGEKGFDSGETLGVFDAFKGHVNSLSVEWRGKPTRRRRMPMSCLEHMNAR